MEINEGLKHDRYGKVIGAVRSIRQPYLDEDESRKNQLQSAAQVILNESIATLEKQTEDKIKYFKDWDNRNLLVHKYTSVQINRKFNHLMEDYLYLDTAKSTLI